MKKLCICIIVISLVLGVSASGSASVGFIMSTREAIRESQAKLPPLTIVVDGKTVNFSEDSKPFIDHRYRIQAPIRALGEALGCTVTWYDSGQDIEFTKIAPADKKCTCHNTQFKIVSYASFTLASAYTEAELDKMLQEYHRIPPMNVECFWTYQCDCELRGAKFASEPYYSWPHNCTCWDFKSDARFEEVDGNWDCYSILGGFDTIEMDASPLVLNNTTYVPARYLAEAFGYVTKWDNKTNIVTITSTDKSHH